jgi:hypothetical protein
VPKPSSPPGPGPRAPAQPVGGQSERVDARPHRHPPGEISNALKRPQDRRAPQPVSTGFSCQPCVSTLGGHVDAPCPRPAAAPPRPIVPRPRRGPTFVSQKNHMVAAFETNIPPPAAHGPERPWFPPKSLPAHPPRETNNPRKRPPDRCAPQPVSTGFLCQPCVSTLGGHVDAPCPRPAAAPPAPSSPAHGGKGPLFLRKTTTSQPSKQTSPAPGRSERDSLACLGRRIRPRGRGREPFCRGRGRERFGSLFAGETSLR